MNRPPLWMRVKVKNERSDFGIWLPLFLIIPLAMILSIILSPFLLIAFLILWPFGWGKLVLLVPCGVIVTFCAMRGLKVNVDNPRESVYVSVV